MWYPVGPSFVFAPRKPQFKRLSRRNERGEQGRVDAILIDPNDSQTIYTIDRPSWGGRAAFRTRDGGESWESILDALLEQDVYVGPICLAINPAHPETLYMGTGWREVSGYHSFGIYVSHDRGNNWQKLGFNLQTAVNQILVDPRTAGDIVHTVLVAGTDNGVYVSRDSGNTWSQCAGTSGMVSSLVADFPAQGNATYYAGVAGRGVFYHQDDSNLIQTWINLNDKNIGLPQSANIRFDRILIDFVPQRRVYAWHFKTGTSVGLYTTQSPMTAWTQAAPANKLPSTNGGYSTFAFAVAPNSPGDGKNDILFFTPRGMSRSIDSGNTWVPVPSANPDLWLHEDGHCFSFFPMRPTGIPLFYHGCDGGIGVSTRYADPNYDIAKLIDYNEDLGYDPNNGVIQNLNHGRQASACWSFASHRELPAINYVGCQDTGTAGGDGLVWRELRESDVGQIAVAPGADGIKVWTSQEVPSELFMQTDKGGLWPPGAVVTLDDGGATLSTSSFEIRQGSRGFAIGLDRNGYAGAQVRWDRSRSTTLTQNVNSGLQWAPVVSMAHIHKGTLLKVDQERVRVLDVSAQEFQANFGASHVQGAFVGLESTTSLSARVVAGGDQWIPVAALDELTVGNAVDLDGELVTIKSTDPQRLAFKADVTRTHEALTSVRLIENHVVRCTHDGVASVISQNFSPDDPSIVTASPVNGNFMYCVTVDNKIWFTDRALTANRATVWQDITGQGLPSSPAIAALTVDVTGVPYLMFSEAIKGNVTSPLFRFNQDLQHPAWDQQICDQLPQPRWFGKLVADPLTDALLYAFADSRVFKLEQSNSKWQWTDISAGLPRDGGLPKQIRVVELWTVNLGDKVTPKILLRAAMLGQGVWEMDITPNAIAKSICLYVRDNVLDQGWLVPSPSGLPNPYDPNEMVQTFHCRDIKFDLIQSGQGVTPDFFQTDPEGSVPLSYVLFEQLLDARKVLVPLSRANVHVQVHNRSHVKANDVSVWAIYATNAKGIPNLEARGNPQLPFKFWSQFGQDGRIYPNLPADSLWRSFGPPVRLSGIDSGHPQIATWNWIVPSDFNPFDYCVAIFVHCSASPLIESSIEVSDFTASQPQVGLLFIGGITPSRPAYLGMVSESVKKALVGVRENSKIFVDPLWDPIRGTSTGTVGLWRILSRLFLRAAEWSVGGLDRRLSRIRVASAQGENAERIHVPLAMRDDLAANIFPADPVVAAFRARADENLQRVYRESD